MNKRFHAFLLAALMVLSLMPTMASAADVEIGTLAELKTFRDSVNGGISGIGHYGNTISASTVEESTIVSIDNNKENDRTNNVGLLVGANQGTESSPTTFEGNTLKNVLGSVSYTDNTRTEFTDRIAGSNIDGGEPVSEGGSSNVVDYTPPPVYAGPVMNWVKVNTADNGVVKSGPLAASAGATVTLYPKAAEGFVLDTIEVLDAEGNAVVLDGLKFAIPAGGVTVNATFKAAQ